MKKGQITVFLSLVLSLLISLILTVVEGARSTAMQLQLDCAADMAIQSVFAEYHRELYEQYDLLFIDSSYGEQTGSYHNTEEHLCGYLMYNIQPGRGIESIGYRDWFDMSLNNVTMTKTRLATDYYGFAVKEQAVSYMKDKVGLTVIENIADWIEITGQYKLNETNIGEELDNLKREIDKEISKKTLADMIWKETKLYKELDRPMATLEMEVMRLLLNEEKEISAQMIDLRNYTSFRNDNNGFGYSITLEPDDLADGIIFGEYIMEKCGNYQKNSNKMHLKYQTEYIIVGGFADDVNLQTVVASIFYLRCAANMISISSDTQKMQEAEVLGVALASLFCIPEAEKVVTQCILCLWAVGEAVCDMKDILGGGRVKLIKGPEDWKLSFAGISSSVAEEGIEQTEAPQGGANGGTIADGLSYEDYLRVFLGLLPLPLKVSRSMDIIEMDIRKTVGNQFFRLDQCMDAITVQITINSSYGQFYLVERKYQYL